MKSSLYSCPLLSLLISLKSFGYSCALHDLLKNIKSNNDLRRSTWKCPYYDATLPQNPHRRNSEDTSRYNQEVLLHGLRQPTMNKNHMENKKCIASLVNYAAKQIQGHR